MVRTVLTLPSRWLGLVFLAALCGWGGTAFGARSGAEDRVAEDVVADASVRAPQVAGTFYPEERSELLGLIHELLKRQPEPTSTHKPRILIVPHAGYQYSGLIAANGFRQLQGHHYDGVVVVGFTHRMQFGGVSVDTRGAYETPLGLLPVDQEAVAILQTYPGMRHVEAAHASNEHSLEVELPFLQVVLDHPRIVPILMGSVNLEDARHLATALAGLARLGDYVFVFSTDLSHYHLHDEAERIDEGTIDAITSETPEAVDRLFSQGAIEACGRGPIVTSLLLAEQLGYLRRQLLYRANSGDTWGDSARVVGYAAIGMYDRKSSHTGQLSHGAGLALVRAAREVLERELAASASGQPQAKIIEAAEKPLQHYHELAKANGMFVTLREHGTLRGCVGRMHTSESLAHSVGSITLDAALRDSRFPPVTASEVPDLQLEVSVLTPPVRVNSPQEIVPGRDGVMLEAAGHSGVFLPQVWQETGWTRKEFLRELASQKAGLPPDAWQQATLSVFQDQAFEEPLPDSRTAH